MKFGSVVTTALQVAVIVLISIGASHVFWRVDAMVKVNQIHIYRYIVYFAAIILWYISTYKYNKYLAFSLSSVLLALAILNHQVVVDSFQAIAPFFAILMGVFAVLLAPATRGRGFVEFLLVLVLPALLGESRLGGSVIPTSEGIVTYELYAVTMAVVGGYLYLRYIASAKITHQELLSRGASEEDTLTISLQNIFIIGTIVAAATASAALLPTATSILTNALQLYFTALPLHIFLLEIIIGMVVVAIIYHFQTSAEKI